MANTLVQYYNEIVKTMGYNSWNHYCASVSEIERNGLKELLKKEFNAKIKNKERQKEWRERQKEKRNVRKK